MKNLLVTFLLGVLCLTTSAQVTTQIRQSASRPLDTTKVAYDEQGKALKYYQYTKLINSGEYTLRIMGDPTSPDSKFMLVKMPEERRAMMADMVMRNMAIKTGVLGQGKVLDLNPLKNALERENFDGKAILMVFWGVGCPPCTEGFSTLNDILKEFKSSDVVSIGVTNDNKDDADNKLREKPLLATHSITGGYKVSGAYGVYEYPTIVVADRNHIIKFAITGSSPFTFTSIKSTLKAAVEGK